MSSEAIAIAVAALVQVGAALVWLGRVIGRAADNQASVNRKLARIERRLQPRRRAVSSEPPPVGRAITRADTDPGGPTEIIRARRASVAWRLPAAKEDDERDDDEP